MIRRQWIKAASLAVNENTGAMLVQTDVAPGATAKRTPVDVSSDDAAGNQVVAAVTGKRISVVGLCLLAEQAVNVTFYSGPGDTGTALTGAVPVADRGGFVLPIAGAPWLQTEVGESLTLVLSAANRCAGWIVYFEE